MAENEEMAEGQNTQWVFGYGSLIWNPGFSFLSAQLGLLRGAHRSLSIISHHHRGTRDTPGLVFGLTRGGSCRGMAFEVGTGAWPEVRGDNSAAGSHGLSSTVFASTGSSCGRMSCCGRDWRAPSKCRGPFRR